MYTRFRLVPKSITFDDLERINGRFRITISSEMAIFSLFTQKYVANYCISNIRPWILLTIGSRLVASMSLELFVWGLYTRTAVVHHPCCSWAFLLSSCLLFSSAFTLDIGALFLLNLFQSFVYIILFILQYLSLIFFVKIQREWHCNSLIVLICR